MYKKLINLAESVDSPVFKNKIKKIAKSLASKKDKVLVDPVEMIGLVSPDKVKYDSEDSIGNVTVDSTYS